MAYMDFSTYNQTGLGAVFSYAAEVEPMFPIVLLGTLYFISLIANLYAQKRISGSADFFSSFAISGIFISIVASLMRYLEIINIWTLSLSIAMGIIGVVLLFIPNEREI